MKTFHVGGMSLLNRFTNLEAALARVNDDDTIELHKNITFSGKIPCNIILNGNGHTLTVENGSIGLDCESEIVIQNLNIVSSPRSNAIILREGGHLSQVTTKIKGPARVLYPTIIVKQKTLQISNCDLMRISADSGAKIIARDTVFRDYYGGIFHIPGTDNASIFAGGAELTNCELNCCYFMGNAILTGCTIRNFNRSCKDVSMQDCIMEPTVNKPSVNLAKEPADGPLQNANEETHFSFEQEMGSLIVNGYRSNLPEEFVGFHIINGSINLSNVDNTDANGYHIIRQASLAFTDCNDTAFYDADDATISMVRSNVNTSVRSKTAMERLQELIGLKGVKAQIKSIMNNITRNQAGNNKDFGFSYHMIFAGDPGTGKTTVAKIIAQALFEIGAIPENKCTEVPADRLVKGFVGQTAEHVRNVLDEALGGVLFIDEAYELTARENTFNSEVLSVLIRYMEDHRDNLIVIAAGYEREMREFLASNVGLTRRFQWVSFEDYTPDEMADIFDSMRISYGESYSQETLGTLVSPLFGKLTGLYKRKPDAWGRITNGGNGGLVRNVFQQVITARNNRVTKNQETDERICELDLKAGFRAEMEKAVNV